MYELDADTEVVPVSDSVFSATVSGRWNIGTVPNGGYVLALVLRAIGRALDKLDPLTATAHYLRPTLEGPCEIHVERVREGKSYATASARLIQQGRERARVLATYGELDRESPVRYVTGVPPRVPAPDEPPGIRPSAIAPEIAKRFDARYDPETSSWMRGKKSGNAELRGAIRFADGRPLDVLSLALFADAFPPPVFDVIEVGWVPTLELTVHFRARPKGEWLHNVFRTRFAFGGLLEEDGEIWDETGTLVAMSRQLAAVPR